MKSKTNNLFENFQNNLNEESILQPYQQFFKSAEKLIDIWKNKGDNIEIIEHKNIESTLSTFFAKPELYKIKINDEDYSLIEFVDGGFGNDDPLIITLLIKGFINESEVSDYINKNYEDIYNEFHKSDSSLSEGFGYKWRPSKTQAREFAQTMSDIDDFCTENRNRTLCF